MKILYNVGMLILCGVGYTFWETGLLHELFKTILIFTPLVAIILALFIEHHSDRVPITNRKRFMIANDDKEDSIGFDDVGQFYREKRAQHKSILPIDDPITIAAQAVLNQILTLDIVRGIIPTLRVYEDFAMSM